MQYGELISRSFSIMWRFKYLWLLAILGGADVTSGGFSGGSGFGGTGGGGGPQGGTPVGPSQEEVSQAVGRFLQDYGGLLVLTGLVLLLIAVAWFALSCVTTGALVRASAEHDAERPFGLGPAWRAGVGTFWSIVGLRLLGLLLALVAVLVLGGLVGLGIALYLSDQSALLAVVIVVGVLAGLALVVIGVLVRIAFILGTRAIVLEQRGAIAGLRRAFELLRARLGRVLLVWLIQVALGIAAGVAIVIVAIPLILVGAVAVVGTGMASGPMAAGILVIPFGLLLLAVLLVLGGMIGTYLSTYWTLAFRRMELDPIPAVAWPPAPQPPGPQPPGPQPPTA